MKKTLFSFCTLLVFTLSHAQVNPTLGVGLETLTMNKGTIDVEVLTKIIMEKQKELKGEALKRFMLKLFPDANYTTKFYIQNCLHILLNEKNPQVIEKEILELTTNYALALGVTYALVNTDNPEMLAANAAYESYIEDDQNKPIDRIHEYVSLIKKVRGERIVWIPYQRNLLRKEFKKYSLEKKLGELIAKNKTDITQSYKNRRKIAAAERNIKNMESRIFKLKQRRKITADDKAYNLVSNAGEIIYAASDSLEEKRKIRRYFRRLKLNRFYSYPEFKKANINYTINLYTDLQYVNIINRYLFTSYIPTPLQNRFRELARVALSERRNMESILSNQNHVMEESEVKKINDELIKVKNFNLNSNTPESISTTPKVKIPFGTLLDVVSLSLSDMDLLQKKGFFKNKVDYREGNFYQNLKSEKDLNYKTALDTLKVKICKKIEPYILHYDVIKEFISKNNKLKDQHKIIDYIKSQAIELISTPLTLSDIEGSGLVLNNTKIISSLGDINTAIKKIENLKAELNSSLTIINAETIKRINYQTELLKNLSQDIINLYNNLLIPNSIANITLAKYIEILAIKSRSYSLEQLIAISHTPDNDAITNDTSLTYTEKILKIISLQNGSSTLSLVPGNYLSLRTDIENLSNTLNNISYNLLYKYIAIRKNEVYNLLVTESGFYKVFVKSALKKTLEKNFKTSTLKIDSTLNSKRATLLSDLYSKLDTILKTENINLSDINYLEKNASKILVELKIQDDNVANDTIYQSLINYSEIIIPLLKIKVLQDIGDVGKYEPELMTLFEFIANLDKLDKAKTFTSIVDMLRTGSDKVEDQLAPGEFKDGYLIFINAMKKYTLINTTQNYVEIDVASFLNELQTYYNRNNNSVCSLYLSIGLNENIFIGGDFKYPNSDQKLDNIGFASEKLGLKFRLHSFTKYGGYENAIKNDVYLNTKAPFINNLYAIVYGSGLLYSLANTATDENFDFAHIGVGFGLRFYNALDVNFTLGLPFVKDGHFGDYPFIGIGFDIPLGEYLEKLGK